jgi:predicted Rossmann-fold nucleotide-binding protein
MRVLVCGGRDYKDPQRVAQVLAKHNSKTPFTAVLTGGASGADELAERWAHAHQIPVETFAADWEKYGKAAGPLRNQRMLVEGKPNIVIAFPGGRGTGDMVNRAMMARVPVYAVTASEPSQRRKTAWNSRTPR